MELNKNFDGNTKLCEWYKIILYNLKKIETDLNSKCNHEDVNGILADKLDVPAETISGIEALKTAYESVGSAAAAINVLANSKLGIKTVDGGSLNTIIDSNTNTMIEVTNVTDAPGGDVQGLLIIGTKTVLWFSSKGDIYRKYDLGTWLCIESSVKVSPNKGNLYYTHSFGKILNSSACESTVGEVDLPMEFRYLACGKIIIEASNETLTSPDAVDYVKVSDNNDYLRWERNGKHAVLYTRIYGSNGSHEVTYDNIMFF